MPCIAIQTHLLIHRTYMNRLIKGTAYQIINFDSYMNCVCLWSGHYGDVIMGVIATQITSLAIVYSTQIKKHHSVTGLCAGNSPGTGEFPAQLASNAETVSIWWRHHFRLVAETSVFILIYREAPLRAPFMRKTARMRYHHNDAPVTQFCLTLILYTSQCLSWSPYFKIDMMLHLDRYINR